MHPNVCAYIPNTCNGVTMQCFCKVAGVSLLICLSFFTYILSIVILVCEWISQHWHVFHTQHVYNIHIFFASRQFSSSFFCVVFLRLLLFGGLLLNSMALHLTGGCILHNFIRDVWLCQLSRVHHNYFGEDK